MFLSARDQRRLRAAVEEAEREELGPVARPPEQAGPYQGFVRLTGAAGADGLAPGVIAHYDVAAGALADVPGTAVWVKDLVSGAHRLAVARGAVTSGGASRGLYVALAAGGGTPGAFVGAKVVRASDLAIASSSLTTVTFEG